MIALVSAECEGAIRNETDTTEMLRKAFKAAKHHWMVLDPDPQMKGALNAVLQKLGEGHADYERLSAEIKLMARVNAWLHASAAGVAGDFPEIPDGYEAIGVMKLWQEAT